MMLFGSSQRVYAELAAPYDENQSAKHEISSDPLAPLNGWSLSRYRIDLGVCSQSNLHKRLWHGIACFDVVTSSYDASQ
jgi:hypothetical protein